MVSKTTPSMKAKVFKLISITPISSEWGVISITIIFTVVTDLTTIGTTTASTAITTIIWKDKVTTVKAEEETA